MSLETLLIVVHVAVWEVIVVMGSLYPVPLSSSHLIMMWPHFNAMHDSPIWSLDPCPHEISQDLDHLIIYLKACLSRKGFKIRPKSHPLASSNPSGKLVHLSYFGSLLPVLHTSISAFTNHHMEDPGSSHMMVVGKVSTALLTLTPKRMAAIIILILRMTMVGRCWMTIPLMT